MNISSPFSVIVLKIIPMIPKGASWIIILTQWEIISAKSPKSSSVFSFPTFLNDSPNTIAQNRILIYFPSINAVTGFEIISVRIFEKTLPIASGAPDVDGSTEAVRGTDTGNKKLAVTDTIAASIILNRYNVITNLKREPRLLLVFGITDIMIKNTKNGAIAFNIPTNKSPSIPMPDN